MRNLAYVRFNNDLKIPVELQLSGITSLAKSIDMVYEDDSSSLDKDRPVIARLLTDAMSSEEVVVYIYDRRCISSDLELCLHYERVFFVAGLEVRFAHSDRAMMDGNFFALLKNSPELERATVASKLLEGRVRKAREGKLASGTPPLGYSTVAGEDGKDYVINKDEAHIVLRSNEIYLEEGSIGKSLDRIEQETGRRFSRQKLHDILTDPIYVGTLRYRGTSVSRPDLRIVGEELRMKVLSLLGRNRKSSSQIVRVRGVRRNC